MALTSNQKTQFNLDFGFIRNRRPGDGPRAAGFVLSGDQECVNFANVQIGVGSYAGASVSGADVAAWIASGGSGPSTPFTDVQILATCAAGSMPATVAAPAAVKPNPPVLKPANWQPDCGPLSPSGLGSPARSGLYFEN